MTLWHPIALPPTRHPWSTPYGFVIDHIWRADGNAARRPHWPEGMFISVQPCVDLDPPTALSEGATHWVFFDDGEEYGAPKGDTLAQDWMVANA